MEPNIFKPSLKFKPRLKYFKFGLRFHRIIWLFRFIISASNRELVHRNLFPFLLFNWKLMTDLSCFALAFAVWEPVLKICSGTSWGDSGGNYCIFSLFIMMTVSLVSLSPTLNLISPRGLEPYFSSLRRVSPYQSNRIH